MNFKVLLNQDPIPGFKMQEEVLMSGDSYGSTNCEQSKEERLKDQFAKGTIRVETKLCHVAYLDEKCLHNVIKKHTLKKEEKKLDTVKSLPYFKGVTRNTRKKIVNALEPRIIEMNQVLIR